MAELTSREQGQNCEDEWPILLELPESAERQALLPPVETLSVSQNGNELTIHLPEQQTGTLRLYDMMGNEIFIRRIIGTELTAKIATDSLASGIYYILFAGSRKFASKVVVTH